MSVWGLSPVGGMSPWEREARGQKAAAVEQLYDAGPAEFGRRTRLLPKAALPGEAAGKEVAVHFMHYNLVRIHQSLRITPAMAAGVTTKLWSLTDMARVIEDWEAARLTKPGNQFFG